MVSNIRGSEREIGVKQVLLYATGGTILIKFIEIDISLLIYMYVVYKRI